MHKQAWEIAKNVSVRVSILTCTVFCPFDPGCTLCERLYTSDCPEHGPVTFIPDAPIQSRARLSLPRPLCLRISVADEPLGKR